MTDSRTPILYIAPWVDLGGADRGTIDWFKYIDRSRWAPSLITMTPSPNRWLHHIEPYAEEIWDLPDLMPGAAFPELILGFIESRGVRVVHIMNTRLAFDLIPDMTCLPDPPAVVVQMHAEEPDGGGYVRYVTRRYASLVDAFSVVSHHLKETVVGYEIPPSKIEVIHLGVDGEIEFDPARAAPLELDGDSAGHVLWPGRLAWEKDPMLTLDVLARSREMGADFILDVVGDGPMKAEVRARAKELGVAEMIHWHPPSQEMPRWYRSTDLLLMTSIYEGVPRVVYEALAMGMPVVAPALPGNAELMDTNSGVLVDPRDDADRYAEAIVSLLGDEGRRREIGSHTRERMLAEFSPAKMARLHGELYERLLRKRPATSRWRNQELLGDADAGRHEPATPPPPPLRLPRDPLPDPTVGVIVPCYRHGIFLDDCIASIKAQTLKPDRIVVVDDGSDDPETLEALTRLERDPEVTVLRQPENCGPSAARNLALAEVQTSYVLPIDADDELLPDALERMLGLLEKAPEDVGFVYPHWHHMGNLTDRVEVPAYNLWLLMQENYCGSPALFDRRLFGDDAVAYPEEIVVGHEDWDLILRLAERGVRGIPADAPTFRYRRQGFSRVNAVDYGPDCFYETFEDRHPHLYLNADALKAEWAPALSIVLLDDEQARWSPAEIAGLASQTCRDFEVLARTGLGEGVRVVGAAAEPLAWLQEAIDMARGRWILLLPRGASVAFSSSSFIEQLLHSYVDNAGTAGIVLGQISSSSSSRFFFSQLDEAERLSADPIAVAFERPAPWAWQPPVRLGHEDSPLASLVASLQAKGPLQWRRIEASGRPWLEYGPGSTPEDRRLDLNLPSAESYPETAMRAKLACLEPRLPELTPGTVRRWEPGELWTPPQTHLLCRHVNCETGLRMVTIGTAPPSGYEFERVLGSTHVYPAPGTKRLIHANHSFEIDSEQGALGKGQIPLGHVENEPLPMLAALELRRVPETGQETIVVGTDDPLLYASEPVRVLGWIEAYPVLPRGRDVIREGYWRIDSLLRHFEGRRHRYDTLAVGEQTEALALGSLHRHPSEVVVPLRRGRDGRLVSDFTSSGRATRDPRKVARWLLEPLRRNRGAARARGFEERLRNLACRFRGTPPTGRPEETLGYLRRDKVPGYSLLYSATHPMTEDQLVTRFPQEAADSGYLLDGILGAILDPSEDLAPPEARS
jgi:glycosyltransferase involved in cell wall biosynthesis